MARLDQALVVRGLARSRSHAAQLIADGRVRRDGATLHKASQSVTETDKLLVTDSESPDFLSRAGHKLDGALSAFPEVQVRDRRCLDAGASTGGFTDVLLRRGAREVVAVDVGHGQLVEQLRTHPRVRVHEGLNVRFLEPAAIGGQVDLTVADLSFISLTLVMEPLARATRHGGALVLMVKPQFEVGRTALSRTGVVTDEARRRSAVVVVVRSAIQLGLEVESIARSPLPGQNGNVEFFVWIKVPERGIVPRIEKDGATLAHDIVGGSAAFAPVGNA
ncbi:23S rRNA (cytidine1920-2'-O)/16S rRNA (cytidine1409-2'-O)-methyltransferase [Arthrobacter pigmenti]|uniref:23S rRNA (Cytidine1920-2'-O)/16S rRNA (Cytidine1409-2'-O)-methyltransferase n=1 Tax=Arthrobacter pigmenti TaxID=271432 RepID=A0A846RNT4_9MICC|nr:23S rRNA (cytidine1920-2'-O)/16S rRNA (cytidine1409-2'-O)-methyltransferase [Arthrobacter pigmenti]